MKVLAIDTAEWSASVALWEEGRELAFEENTHSKDQAVILPGLVKQVLGSHEVDFFLVNRGPGSFTGIRVGLAFAKGLALGVRIPLKGIDNFTATYESLKGEEFGRKDVLVLLEAHRGDVFGRFYQKGVPKDSHSFTRQDIEKILECSIPPLLAGSGVRPFCEGLSFKEAPSSWKGAQRLAYAFFKDKALATEPFPFYGREADINFSFSF